MNILITGGAGFIGSHLCDRLIAEGHRVTALDDLSTGSTENIAHLQNNQLFSFVHGSIFDYKLMEKIISSSDAVIHLAAAVGVKLIVKKPIHTILTNIRGTEIVLDLCGKYKKRLLMASTSEVYGKSTKFPFKENDDMVLGPTTKSRWSYACSKAIDEFLALAYFKEKNLSVTILRFFNTVGPRQTGKWGMVIPTFVGQALTNNPITVYGDGSQKRCFCSVKDCVEYIVRILPLNQSYGEVYNIGNPSEISILELAKLIKDRCNSSSPIVHIPYDEAYETGFEDMERRLPDISKVVELTGYKPLEPLESIVDSTAAYFSEKMK